MMKKLGLLLLFLSLPAQAEPIKFSELQGIFNRAQIIVIPSTYPPDTAVHNIVWIKYDLQSNWTGQVWRVCTELNYRSPDSNQIVTEYMNKFFSITLPANAPEWCRQ